MPRPKRDLHAVAQSTITPPDQLPSTQSIARVAQNAGNNLYQLELPSADTVLAELPTRFRSTIWIKRGTFVVVDTAALAGRENKIGGEIVNVVREEKAWRRMAYWPKEFEAKRATYDEDDEDEDEGPRMPASDSENEG